jgi:hypothetical protein
LEDELENGASLDDSQHLDEIVEPVKLDEPSKTYQLNPVHDPS